MWALLVIDTDPVTDYAAGMLQGFKPIPMGTRLLQCLDHPFHLAVLIRAVRRDEFLLQTIAFQQRRVMPAGKYPAVIVAQQELFAYPPQATKAGDERPLQRCFDSLRFAASLQVPTPQFPGMEVDYLGQRAPAITAGPDPAKAGSPALIGRLNGP